MKIKGIFLILVLSVQAFSFSAMAANNVLASVSMSPSAIDWQPYKQYEQITLTVRGPAGTISDTFQNGSAPYFEVGSSADGNYTYELSVTPVISDQVRANLKRSREEGDMSIVADMKRQGVLPTGPTRQSGHFRILNGAILVDTTPEG